MSPNLSQCPFNTFLFSLKQFNNLKFWVSRKNLWILPRRSMWSLFATNQQAFPYATNYNFHKLRYKELSMKAYSMYRCAVKFLFHTSSNILLSYICVTTWRNKIVLHELCSTNPPWFCSIPTDWKGYKN